MRTTIDIPDELHSTLLSLARDNQQSVSKTVVDLVRQLVDPPARPEIRIDPRTGFPVLHGLGRVITSDDVRSLEDDA